MNIWMSGKFKRTSLPEKEYYNNLIIKNITHAVYMHAKSL